MGNCLYKVFLIGSPPENSSAEEWKRQTDGKVENPLYALMDVGKEGGEILTLYRRGGEALLQAALRGDRILLPYLYEDGRGRTVTKEDYLWVRRKKRVGQVQT